MKTLPDPKHEAFATLRASGHDLASAYVHAGYSVKNIKSRSRKLLKNPDIQARIEHLRSCLPRITELHQHHCPTLLLMPETRHEMLVWLWQVMNGTRAIKPAQMRAATLYSRLQGWHLAKLLPQAQAQQQVQAGCPGAAPDAADQSPIPTSTLTEDEKAFLAFSNRENIAHERTLMPRSPENLARYQSALATFAHPACRQDAFGRPLPDEISQSTSATTPAPASPITSTKPSIQQTPAQNPRPVNPSNPAILSKNPPPESPQSIAPSPAGPSVRPVSPVRPVLSSPNPITPPANPANPVILSKKSETPPQNPQPNPHPKPLTLNPLPPRTPQPRSFLFSTKAFKYSGHSCPPPHPRTLLLSSKLDPSSAGPAPTRLNLPPRKTPRPLAATH